MRASLRNYGEEHYAIVLILRAKLTRSLKSSDAAEIAAAITRADSPTITLDLPPPLPPSLSLSLSLSLAGILNPRARDSDSLNRAILWTEPPREWGGPALL